MKNFFLLPTAIFLFILLFVGKSPIHAIAPIGNYLELSGGHVKAVSEDPTSPPGFTFEAWVNPKSLSGTQKILSIGDKSLGILHYEVGINGGALSFIYNNGQGGNTSISAGTLEAGKWQHVAVTISSAATKIFIDGQPIFSPAISHSQLLQIGQDIVLGNSYKQDFQSSKPFKGAIDEVRISGIARDVGSLWSGGVYYNSLTLDQNTALLWRLDDSRGNLVAPDSGVQQSDGLLVGGDSLIHFFGVVPTPTPFSFGLSPINWTRPVLPTLSLPRSNPPRDNIQPPPPGIPFPTVSSIRNFPRRSVR